MADTSSTTNDNFGGEGELTAWERRLIGAIGVVAAARKGALAARVASIIIAAGALVGVAILSFWTEKYPEYSYGGPTVSWEFEWTMHNLGQFFQGVAAPLAFAAIVFAVSCMIEVAAARLDIEIVLADDETDTDSE